MRLYLDACNTDYIPVAPVLTVSSASVARMLDGAGSIRMSVPLQDENARTLLTVKRRFILYGTLADGKTRVELTRGIINNVSDTADGSRDIDAIDALDELRRRTTLLGRRFDGISLVTSSLTVILTTLVGLAGGWAIVTPTAWASELRADRFDGASILKACLSLMEKRGSHLRLGAGRTIEFGDFGTAGLPNLIGGMHFASYEATLNDDEAWVEGITVETSADDLCTRLIPVGAGEGEAALNLRYSTRTTPYAIQSSVVNSKTNRFIADAGAEALYGIHEQVLKFDITPISNSTTAMQIADNALYDAAVAYLQRHITPLTTYSVTLRKCERVPLPGDKLHLRYQGYTTDRIKRKRVFIDVDKDVWVMRVNQRIGTAGRTVSLVLADIDRRQQDMSEVVIGAIENVELRGLKPATFPSTATLYGSDVMRSAVVGNPVFQKNARFAFRLANFMTDLIAAQLNVRTAPLFATAAPPLSVTNGFNWDVVIDDGNFPSNIRLLINGADVSATFGGPWNTHPTNAALDITVDITDIIRSAPSGIYQAHVIELASDAPLSGMRNVDMKDVSRPAATALRTFGMANFSLVMLTTNQAILLS